VLRGGKVGDGCLLKRSAAVADARSLEARRQEGGAVVLRTAMIDRRAERDESRKVLVVTAQSVESPGAKAWPVEGVVAGVERQEGRAMRHLVAAVHRAEDS